MALTTELSIAISSDRETGTLSNETADYGTGGNPARADLRIFATGYKVSADLSEEEITLTSDTGDAQTVSNWSYPQGVDGWYKFPFVAVVEYDAGTSYSQYDAVFDPSDDVVYRSLQNGNIGQSLSNPTYWEEIEDPSSLSENEGEANESQNLAQSLVYERVLTPNSEYAYSNLVGAACACSDCDEGETIYNYQLASLWLNGMIVADEREETLKGETIARRYQSKFIDNC